MTEVVLALVLPLLLLAVATLGNIRRGINLGDEGYLVYGTQAVLRGEVPIRDFRAYDPARYYWCALWFRLIGPGFITVRIAMTVVSVGSVFLIVVLVNHATGNAPLASLTAGLSLVWMRPIHKQIEIFFSIICCAIMYALLIDIGYLPVLGAIGGISAVFGLNIAVYFMASAILVLIAGSIHQSGFLLASGPPFLSGFIVGSLGIVLIFALIPNFLRAYLDRKIYALLRRGTSNLALPKPWLWGKSVPQLKQYGKLRQLVHRSIFTVLPMAYMAAIVVGILTTNNANFREMALLIATACTGIVYFHHLLSRADLAHTYQIIHPFLLLVAVSSQILFGPTGAIAVTVFSFTASVLLLFREPIFIFGSFSKMPKKIPFKFKTDRFLLSQNEINRLTHIDSLICAHMNSNSRLFCAPNIPGFLALFGLETAVYDTFPIYPASLDARQTMLTELIRSAPTVAIVSKFKVDGRDDLLFENNYPEVTDYIRRNYEVAFDGKLETVYKKNAL